MVLTLGRMHRIVLALLLVAPLASGIPGGDAGSGRDAGGTRDTAFLLPGYGEYTASLNKADVDWFRVDRGDSGLTCLESSIVPTRAAVTSLSAVGPSGNRTATVVAPANVTTRLAIASTSFVASAKGVGPAINPNDDTYYTFRVNASNFTSATFPDPFATGGAITPGSCVSGDLVTAINPLDQYTLHLTAGQMVWYSLAATGPVQLVLTHANGTAVGPAIVTDQLAGAVVPATGTYTLSASAGMLAVGRLDYVAGLGIGAEVDSNPCRPYCIALA